MPDTTLVIHGKNLSKEALASLRADVAKTAQEFNKVHEGNVKIADSSKNAISGLKGIASIIGTIGLAKLGTDIVGAATKWDSMEKSLLYVEKRQDAVNKRLAEFRQIAKEPGIGLQQLTQGYIGFTSAGMKSEPAIRLMRELANNMAAMGKGATEIERVNYQLIQMKSKGLPQLEDIRVIQEAMPNINELIRKAFGTVDTKALAEKGVDADKFIAGITEAMSKQERAATGARNAQDNFNDSLFQFKAAIGESVLPAVTDFLTGATKVFDWFNEMPDSIQKVIGVSAVTGGGILGLALAVTTLSNALGTLGIKNLGGGLANVATTLKNVASYDIGYDFRTSGLKGINPAVTAGVAAAGLGALAISAHNIYVSATNAELVEKGSTEGKNAYIKEGNTKLVKLIEDQINAFKGITLESTLSDLSESLKRSPMMLKEAFEQTGFYPESNLTLLSVLQKISPKDYPKFEYNRSRLPYGPPEPPPKPEFKSFGAGVDLLTFSGESMKKLVRETPLYEQPEYKYREAFQIPGNLASVKKAAEQANMIRVAYEKDQWNWQMRKSGILFENANVKPLSAIDTIGLGRKPGEGVSGLGLFDVSGWMKDQKRIEKATEEVDEAKKKARMKEAQELLKIRDRELKEALELRDEQLQVYQDLADGIGRAFGRIPGDIIKNFGHLDQVLKNLMLSIGETMLQTLSAKLAGKATGFLMDAAFSLLFPQAGLTGSVAGLTSILGPGIGAAVSTGNMSSLLTGAPVFDDPHNDRMAYNMGQRQAVIKLGKKSMSDFSKNFNEGFKDAGRERPINLNVYLDGKQIAASVKKQTDKRKKRGEWA